MNSNFGESLKEIRIAAGVKQTELAKAIGVSKGCISLWENNLREPTLSNLLTLADFFKVSLDELVGR